MIFINPFSTRHLVKDFILRVAGLTPKYIDLQKQGKQAVLRFEKKVEADFCVKQILNAKWGDGAAKASIDPPLEGTIEGTIH